jgi:uncharacterized ferritin-like protein (DUF455 family)
VTRAPFTAAESADFLVGQVSFWEGLLAWYAARAIDAAELELKLAAAALVWDAARMAAALRTRAAELGASAGGRQVQDPAPDGLSRREQLSWLLDQVLAPNEPRLAHAVARCEPVADEPSLVLLRGGEALLVRHHRLLAALLAEPALLWTNSPRAVPARDPRLGSASGPRAPVPPTVEVLHRTFTDVELPTIELCASALLEFPDMPVDFGLDMARQCADEARHARLFRTRLEELGGALGQVGYQTFLWELCVGRPLAMQLAINQRWGEWGGVCGARWHAERLRAEGDPATGALFEYVMADELLHVAAGNRWIAWLVPDPAERAQLDEEAAALRRAAGRSAPPDATFPFERALCERCGFEAREVDWLEQHYHAAGSRMPPVSAPR